MSFLFYIPGTRLNWGGIVLKLKGTEREEVRERRRVLPSNYIEYSLQGKSVKKNWRSRGNGKNKLTSCKIIFHIIRIFVFKCQKQMK